MFKGMNTPTIILVTVSFVSLLGSSYLLLSEESLFERQEKTSGEVAGQVVYVQGDLRRKSSDQVRWDPLKNAATLFQNDSIYSGKESKSEILFDNKRIVLGADTLIILSQNHRNQREINFEYGNFVAEVDKGESLEVNIAGKTIKIDGREKSKISVIQTKEKKPEVKVLSGVASVAPVKTPPEPKHVHQQPKPQIEQQARQIESLPTHPIYPPENQVFPSRNGEAEITLVGKLPANHQLELQLVKDGEEFDSDEVETVIGDRVKKTLEPGNYRWRMRTLAVGLKPSAWTKEASFSIRPSHLSLPLANHLPRQVGLHQKESLENFFKEIRLPENGWLEVSHLHTAKIYRVDDGRWPAELSKAGLFQYSYRLRKQGYYASPWSTPRWLQIYLRPPENLRVHAPQDVKPDEKGKITVKIEWKSPQHDLPFEVQISRDKSFSKKTSLPASASQKYLGVYVNTEYFVRVRVLDKNNKKDQRALSAFSKTATLHVPYIKEEPKLNLTLTSPLIPGAQERASRAPGSKPEASSEMQLSAEEMGSSQNSKAWIWIGTGMNFLNYEQALNQKADVNFSSNQSSNYYFSAGWMSPASWGVDTSYKVTPGEVSDNQNYVDNKSFEWTTLTLDGLYILPWTLHLGKSPLVTHLRAGVQTHEIPHLYLNSSDELSIAENTLMTGALGMGSELNQGNWQYSIFMRYQHPISSQVSSASSFSLKPNIAFDGSLGVSYAFAERFRMGFFWYGHWINYDFNYVDNNSDQSGFQSIFFSNMDLRLGLEF